MGADPERGQRCSPRLGAHLGVAAPDLDDPVADGKEQFQNTSGVPVLGLHQGLAQGQPHFTGQEVLAVLPGGPASQGGALGYWQDTLHCLTQVS